MMRPLTKGATIPRNHLVALTGIMAAIGAAGISWVLYGGSSCNIEVTPAQSLAFEIDAASKRGCNEATVIHHCPNGKVSTSTALVPTPATLAALQRIATGAKNSRLLIPIELDGQIHQQVDLPTADPTAY